MKSYLGDADLYVATNDRWPHAGSFEYASRRNDHIDRVILTASVADGPLPTEIFIGVHGVSYAEYELDINFEYHATHNEKLESAFPLHENRSMLHKVDDPYDEAFLAYTPWWSQHEQRSIIMISDSPYKDIVFYVDVDDYPKSYQTDWMARNGMFSLHPWNPGYSREEDG